jgi:hypothetical protein
MEPICNTEFFFSRNLNAAAFARSLSCNAASFAWNLSSTLNPLQGTYLQHWILFKEPICNAASVVRNLSATLHSLQGRNLSTTLNPLQGTYLQHWILCKEPIYCKEPIRNVKLFCNEPNGITDSFNKKPISYIYSNWTETTHESWETRLPWNLNNCSCDYLQKCCSHAGYSAANRVFKLDTRTPFHGVYLHIYIRGYFIHLSRVIYGILYKICIYMYT